MPVIPWLALALLAWLASAPPALAHTGQPPTPQDIWAVWNWSLALWLAFGLAGWAYARGWHILEQHRQWPPAWQTASFMGGMSLAFVALISPLDAAGSALLSAHMVQHVLLIMGVAPLLAVSKPLGPLLLGLPKPMGQRLGNAWRGAAWLRRAWELLRHPAIVGAMPALALWGWHIPFAYQAALGNQWVHDAEHLTFLGTALFFWWWVLRPARQRGSNIAVSFLVVFVVGLTSTALALLITTSPRPWYLAYSGSTLAWGLTALQDQQMAGAIMWVPSALVYLCAIVGLLAGWLRHMDRTSRQRQPEWLAAQESNWEH
jgi:putative membrane protein